MDYLCLFKRLGTCLAEPLSAVFNSFFSVHQMPSMWSEAIITPVFKRGKSCDVSNHEPISTVTNLLESGNDWTLTLNDKHTVGLTKKIESAHDSRNVFCVVVT